MDPGGAGGSVRSLDRWVMNKRTWRAIKGEDESGGGRRGMRAEERLDRLEGTGKLEQEEEEVVELYQEDMEAVLKLMSTLKDHLGHWEESGATRYVLQVIREGYKPSFKGLPKDFC